MVDVEIDGQYLEELCSVDGDGVYCEDGTLEIPVEAFTLDSGEMYEFIDDNIKDIAIALVENPDLYAKLMKVIDELKARSK